MVTEARAKQIRKAGARWRTKNKERERARSTVYREDNPEKVRKTSRDSYARNRILRQEGQKRWREENKEHLREKERKRRRKRNKQWALVERYKLFCGCAVCGLRGGPAYWYDCHHTVPEEKSFEIGRSHHYTIKKVRAELRKCVVLCAICHRDVEHKTKTPNSLSSV